MTQHTPYRIWLFLAVGLVALSQSANIIRIGEAHPVAISAWRLVLATLFFLPIAGKNIFSLFKLPDTDKLLLLLAGAGFALHFITWITAVQKTTVANATLFMAMNPVITAVSAYFLFGEKASRRLVLAILIGLVGILVLCINDIQLSPHHLIGDGLSLLSSAFLTGCFMIAKRLRKTIEAKVYVTGLYAVAALICVAVGLFMELPVLDYNKQTWLCFALMAIVPTVIGHTSLNTAFLYIDAGKVAALTLVEPIFAGVVAYVAWGESVTGLVYMGYFLICGSVLLIGFDKPKTKNT